MTIVEQPNNWSCMACAFATVLDISLNVIVKLLGHDGSEIINPNQPEPKNRAGFQVHEMAWICFLLQWSCTVFDETTFVGDGDDVRESSWVDWEGMLDQLMTDSIGVIGGITPNGMYHAAAWDGRQCLDPCGFIYPRSHYKIITFCRLEKSCGDTPKNIS